MLAVLNLCSFNSIKVQLRRREYLKKFRQMFFQFHKGTIRASATSSRSVCVIAFNSIKVQLMPAHENVIKDTERPFNSIKVQLRHASVHTCIYAYTLFQFHKGTIKAIRLLFLKTFPFPFNSIKVQLRQG